MKESLIRKYGCTMFISVATLLGSARSLIAQQVQVVAVSPLEAGLNDRVEVTVDHLGPLQDAAKGHKLVLFLSGMEIPQVYPEAVVPLADGKGVLRFPLIRKSESMKAWGALLGRPVFLRNLPLSVGIEGGTSLTGEQEFHLVVMGKVRFFLWLGVMILILYLLFRLARDSDLLRGSGPEKLTAFLQQLGVQLPPGSRRPFSLGQTQMAFWFFIIIGSFFFIWVVTADVDTLSDSILVLMGIGTGTALGAAMVDSGKRTSAESEARGLLAEKNQLEADLARLRPRVILVPSPMDLATLQQDLTKKQSRVAEIDHRLEAITPVLQGGVSEGFFQDILTDENGVSLHRFQMAAWTAILGLVFIFSVYGNLAMPTFNGTLLALLGISSGTYVGFKIPEKA
jgi:hypothetical protein